jgi:hypothetical protein
MLSLLRRNFDSVVYTGLEPDRRNGSAEPEPPLHRLSAFIERFIGAGSAPSDPLYLSRRTTLQKSGIAVLVTAPLLIVAGLVALVLSGYFRPAAPPEPEPTSARAELPLPAPAALSVERDAEVLEIKLDRAIGLRVTGTLKNNTGQPLNVEMVIDLADENGSRVAALKHVVEHAPAGSSQFSFPATQASAAYALVREIRTVRSGSSR